MSATTIQWTDETWNPVTGCTKVSQGCKHCYAERIFARPYPGRKFTDVRTHPERLDQPLGWLKPRRVFVNSMSDLFHEDVPDEFIDKVWGAMANAPNHTFQVLTKRPARMLAWTGGVDAGKWPMWLLPWPLPNVWLGVSVEDQATADERIPLLLQTPAAVRFVSYEPALAPVNFTRISLGKSAERVAWSGGPLDQFKSVEFTVNALRGAKSLKWSGLSWVIVGGESGQKARPFDVDWARSTIAQCKAAGVPCFVKQLGARPVALRDTLDTVGYRMPLNDRAGGDPSEWPEDLRVRQWPLVESTEPEEQ